MAHAKLHLKLNVGYRLYDKMGRVKKTFQENALFTWLMKKGILSPLAPKIPFFLGHWTESAVRANLITNAGVAAVAGLIGNVGSVSTFGYIAVGTGTNAASAADTTLQTETATSGLSRAASTNSRVTTDVTNDTIQFLKSFSVSDSVAVTESGVLNASSAGDLLCRQVFSAINVVNGDTLQITWKVDCD
jgi:hypothetical protein